MIERGYKRLTKLLDITALVSSILFETFLELRTVCPHKLADSSHSVCVFTSALKRLDSAQVLSAYIFQLGDGEFWQVVLVGECDARLRLR